MIDLFENYLRLKKNRIKIYIQKEIVEEGYTVD
jgi:hypothetical protein